MEERIIIEEGGVKGSAMKMVYVPFIGENKNIESQPGSEPVFSEHHALTS